MLDPTTPITVKLQAQQWNTVLSVLAEGPFRVVSGLVQTIQEQCMMHDPDRQMPQGNGEIRPSLPS